MQNYLLIIPESGAQGHSGSTRKTRALEVSTWLKATFPCLFASYPLRPLAVGIHGELREMHPNINRAALRLALAWHASKPAYLRALAAPDAMRYDLDGNPVEPVIAEQRDFAKTRLAEWQKAHEGSAESIQEGPHGPPGETPGFIFQAT